MTLDMWPRLLLQQRSAGRQKNELTLHILMQIRLVCWSVCTQKTQLLRSEQARPHFCLSVMWWALNTICWLHSLQQGDTQSPVSPTSLHLHTHSPAPASPLNTLTWWNPPDAFSGEAKGVPPMQSSTLETSNTPVNRKAFVFQPDTLTGSVNLSVLRVGQLQN